MRAWGTISFQDDSVEDDVTHHTKEVEGADHDEEYRDPHRNVDMLHALPEPNDKRRCRDLGRESDCVGICEWRCQN